MTTYNDYIKDRTEALNHDEILRALEELLRLKVITDEDLKGVVSSSYSERKVCALALNLLRKNLAVSNRLYETQTIPEKLNLLSYQQTITSTLSYLATVIGKENQASLTKLNQYLLSK